MNSVRESISMFNGLGENSSQGNPVEPEIKKEECQLIVCSVVLVNKLRFICDDMLTRCFLGLTKKPKNEEIMKEIMDEFDELIEAIDKENAKK